jgi:hypothetical protein
MAGNATSQNRVPVVRTHPAGFRSLFQLRSETGRCQQLVELWRVQAIHRGTFVVAVEKKDVIAEPHLRGKKQTDTLNGFSAVINGVAEEKVRNIGSASGGSGIGGR